MAEEATTQTLRRWRADDMLTYEEACAEFTEWTPRTLRHLRAQGHIEGVPGKNGAIHFKYADLIALRERRRLQFVGQHGGKSRQGRRK